MSNAARTLVAVAILAAVVAVVSTVCGIQLYRATQHSPAGTVRAASPVPVRDSRLPPHRPSA